MPTTELREGTYSLDYHLGRQTRRALVYRLARRTAEVRRTVVRYSRRPIRAVLDVGTADGLMLQRLRAVWPQAQCLGLDLSRELLLAAPDPAVLRVEANALNLPFPDDTFDLVIATAIIEHVTAPPPRWSPSATGYWPRMVSVSSPHLTPSSSGLPPLSATCLTRDTMRPLTWGNCANSSLTRVSSCWKPRSL